MNLIGIDALVWAREFTNDVITDAICYSKKAGFDLIGFPMNLLSDPQDLNVEGVVALLQKYKMHLACSYYLSIASDLSNSYPFISDQEMEAFEKMVMLAHRLGSRSLGLVFRDTASGTGSTGREQIAEILKHIARSVTLVSSNLKVGIEVVNRYESACINTAREALELLEMVGASNLFIHLDTYHMNIEEENFFEPVLTCDERLGYIRVSENHRGYLGSGLVNFKDFFQALGLIRYQGPLTFKGLLSSDALCADSLRASRVGIYKTPRELKESAAEQAGQFIRAHLQGTRYLC